MAEIEERYESRKQAIKDKYMNQWTQEWYINNMSQIKEEEATHQAKEEEEAEGLLDSLE
jgi:hypothetical protein